MSRPENFLDDIELEETTLETEILILRLQRMLGVAEAEEARLVGQGYVGPALDQLRDAMANARAEVERLSALLLVTRLERSSSEPGFP